MGQNAESNHNFSPVTQLMNGFLLLEFQAYIINKKYKPHVNNFGQYTGCSRDEALIETRVAFKFCLLQFFYLVCQEI